MQAMNNLIVLYRVPMKDHGLKEIQDALKAGIVEFSTDNPEMLRSKGQASDKHRAFFAWYLANY